MNRDLGAGGAAAQAAAPPATGVGAEFAAGWPVVLGAILGIGVGVVALPSLGIGLSMSQLQTEFGWTRTQISLGPTILVAILALTAPAVGWLADRIHSVWIALVSLSALAVAFLLLSRLGPDVRIYYAGFAAMALTASGASTLIYARIISASFDRGRGLALGIAMIGNGVTSAVLPLFMVPYISSHGWRAGLVALAAIVLVALPVVGLLIARGRSPVARSGGRGSPEADVPGAELGVALRDPLMWAMVVCFALITLAAAGINFHFVAFLTDAGVEPMQVGATAGLIGISLIVSRIATGWLLDRIFAPYVAAAMMLLSGAGVAALALGGAVAAPAGAIAVGLSIGSEIDLIGYFTARYFGLRAYGRIYGIQYSACLVGGAVSPLAYGMVVDATGSYQVAMSAAALILFACAIAFWRFPPFDRGRRAGREAAHRSTPAMGAP